MFKTRGPVTEADNCPYILRNIDHELMQLVQKVDYVALMGPRSSGKTSVLMHLWEGIKEVSRYVVCYVNLSLYRSLDETRWYKAVSQALVESSGGALISLDPPVEDVIDLREMLLVNLQAYISDRILVILLDDVESVPLDIRTAFFATLREMFVSRGIQPAFRRLSFTLAGSYIPDELIPDPTISPFRVAEKLYLEDAEDIQALVNHLVSEQRQLSTDVGARIAEWTEGDLYLTQRLCEKLDQKHPIGHITPIDVDQIVERYLLDDPLFENLEGKLSDHARVFDLVDSIIRKETSLRFTRTNRAISHAWLMGCLKANAFGNCIARNAVYQQVLQNILRELKNTPNRDPITVEIVPDRQPAPLKGRYLIEGVIKRSLLSHIYRARDQKTGEVVVVKQLSPHGGDIIAWRRFQREGEALRHLNHPHIVRLMDIFHEDENSYIVMEYVSGGSLDNLLSREGRQPIPLLLDIMIGVADALRYTHAQNIVHRDIKPSNILLTTQHKPLLADFGVAHFANQADRLTATYAIIGTPAYISPEGYNTALFTPTEDVWSLGVTLYELLTGLLPFNGRTHEHIRHAILHNPIPDARHIRPDIPPTIAELLNHMLQRDPNQRLPNGEAVYEHLRQIRANLPD